MNYYMILTAGMNIRKTAEVIGARITDTPNNIIRVIPTGTRVEGDDLNADGRFLNVLLIDGLQVTEPTHIATYTTSGKLVTNPPPIVVPPLPFYMGVTIEADSAIKLYRIELDGSRTLVAESPAGVYVVEFMANDSNRPFIRMD